MSTAVWTTRLELSSVADKSLKAAARFWFVVALAGQFAFAISVAVFYGLTALRGNIQAWNRILGRGFETGATMSNTALVGHILFGTVISIAGALQLIPGIRNRFPVFHRWNGRLFVLAAFTQAITGIYLTLWVGKRVGDTTQHVISVLCTQFHHSSPLGSPPVPCSERLLVHPAGIRRDAGCAWTDRFRFEDVQRTLGHLLVNRSVSSAPRGP